MYLETIYRVVLHETGAYALDIVAQQSLNDPLGGEVEYHIHYHPLESGIIKPSPEARIWWLNADDLIAIGATALRAAQAGGFDLTDTLAALQGPTPPSEEEVVLTDPHVVIADPYGSPRGVVFPNQETALKSKEYDTEGAFIAPLVEESS